MENPQLQILGSYYTPYLERCPRKEWKCFYDPGFIEYYYPDFFREIFGNITPREAVEHEKSKCRNCPYEEKNITLKEEEKKNEENSN